MLTCVMYQEKFPQTEPEYLLGSAIDQCWEGKKRILSTIQTTRLTKSLLRLYGKLYPLHHGLRGHEGHPATSKFRQYSSTVEGLTLPLNCVHLNHQLNEELSCYLYKVL